MCLSSRQASTSVELGCNMDEEMNDEGELDDQNMKNSFDDDSEKFSGFIEADAEGELHDDDDNDDEHPDLSTAFTSHYGIDDDGSDQLEATDFVDAQENDPVEVLDSCLRKLQGGDFVMEPDVVDTINHYMEAGGSADQVVNCLSSNYQGFAQIANTFADWLITLGSSLADVQSAVERKLCELLLRHFDPKKADSIFHLQGGGDQIEWLPELISHTPWRQLIYQLSEHHQECLLLNFGIKLISDAGYQHEIFTSSLIIQQLDIFCRVLCVAMDNVLAEPFGSVKCKRAITELAKIACQAEHTYLFTYALLCKLAQESKVGASAVRRICQELRRYAQHNKHDTTAHTLSLHNSGGGSSPTAVVQALHSMLSKESLNPADVTQLYGYYSSNDPPSVDLIRDPKFVELLVDALFRPGNRLNPEHMPKYVYLLAYAASVSETYKKGQRRQHNRDELKTAQSAIEKAHLLCLSKEASHELLAELNTFFTVLRTPVVAHGLLHWIRCTVTDATYFSLHTEPPALHLTLIDEIVNLHNLLHDEVFELLVSLFDLELEQLEVFARINLKRMLIERMVHMMSKGYVLQVIEFVRERWVQQDTDTSLIRYFVMETLEMVAPPYSTEFVEAFLPLVADGSITGTGAERPEAVIEFLAHCQQ